MRATLPLFDAREAEAREAEAREAEAREDARERPRP
jgi:hypothetical protein